MSSTTLGPHKLVTTDRSGCHVTGINGILSMNDAEIILDTPQGMMMIKGDKLGIIKMIAEDHEISIHGHINSITYAEK